jgi:type II secretion system protein H
VNRRVGHVEPGFTLIELILVLVLIALITTAATPALRGFTQRGSLDDAAAALLTLTRQAQTRAAHESVPYRIVFNLDAHTAWLEKIGDEGFEIIDETGVEPITWNRELTIASDIEPDIYQQLVINFDPTGLVTPGSFVLERDRHLLALTCDAATERYRLVTPARQTNQDAQEALDAMRL